MNQQPKYDNDYVTKSYLDKALSNTNKNTIEYIAKTPTNYSSCPAPPYYKDSILMDNGNLYKAIKDKLQGLFTWNDWVLVATDNTSLNEFAETTYGTEQLEIIPQQDDKIETFYQEEDPSEEWTTDIKKNNHVGDYWYNKLTNIQKKYTKISTNPITYEWKPVNVPVSIYDIVDGHKNIFLKKPTSYSKDDLWIIESSISSYDIPVNVENPIASGDWVLSLVDNESYNKYDWINLGDEVKITYVKDHLYTLGEINKKFNELERQTTSSINKYKNAIEIKVSHEYTTKEETEQIQLDYDTQIGTINTSLTSHGESIGALNIEANRISSIVSSNENAINELNENVYTKEQSNVLIQTATTGLTNTFKNVGGNNLYKNSYFSEKENGLLTFWQGSAEPIIYNQSESGTALSLKNGIEKQTVNLINGTYSNSIKYKRLINTANATIKYNAKTFVLDDEGTISSTGDVSTSSITLEIECDTDDGYIIYEPMLNKGNENSTFSQNANESNTDTVNIGKGIQVNNSAINSYTRQDADGFRGFNASNNEITFKQTSDGLYSKKMETESAEIGTLIISSKNGHNFMSGM